MVEVTWELGQFQRMGRRLKKFRRRYMIKRLNLHAQIFSVCLKGLPCEDLGHSLEKSQGGGPCVGGV